MIDGHNNPYAPPQVADVLTLPGDWPEYAPGLWRDGELLVVRRDAEVPPVCPASNEPAEARVTSYFPWSPKDLYPLRFGLIIGVLYWLSRVKHTVLRVPITPAARQSRAWRMSLAAILALAGVGLIGLLFWLTTQQAQQAHQPGQSFLEKEGKVLKVTGAAFACVIGAMFAMHKLPDPTNSLLVRGVEGDHIWLAGAHPQYLVRLPTFEGRRPAA